MQCRGIFMSKNIWTNFYFGILGRYLYNKTLYLQMNLSS